MSFVNRQCERCDAKNECSDVLKGWLGYKTHRQDFVKQVVQLAVKHGRIMECLKAGEKV
jgi:hypothetical protein